MAIEITDKTITSILAENEYTVIDFWAEWCAPCRMLTPIIDEIAKENDRFLMGKLNVTDNSNAATEHKISSIPCLVIFKKNTEIGRLKGVMPKALIVKKITEIIGQ